MSIIYKYTHFEGNLSLAALDLSQNNFTAAGAKYLIRMLKGKNAITVLKIAGNNFQRAGEAEILRDIEPVTSLISLKGFTDKDGKIGFHVARNNDQFHLKLKQMDLTDEPLTPQQLLILYKQLQASLTTFYSSANLSYADLRGAETYMKKIAAKFKALTEASTASLESGAGAGVARGDDSTGSSGAPIDEYRQELLDCKILGLLEEGHGVELSFEVFG